MKQRFFYLKSYYLNDLMEDVQKKISEMNEDKYYLVDFKFSGLEDINGYGFGSCGNAYLLFEQRN